MFLPVIALLGVIVLQVSTAAEEEDAAMLKRADGWVLAEIKEGGKVVELVPGGRTQLSFKDKQVTGTGGVNSFFGSYELGEGGKIEFGGFGSTLRGGPRNLMDQEARILALLDKATSYSIEDGKLILSDESGDNCLKYVPKEKK